MPAHRHEVPRYTAFHARIRRGRGPAAAHLCAAPGCDRQAAQWAWDRQGPSVEETRADGTRVRYSLDEARYEPLCRTHHNERDRPARKTVCRHGHDIPPERWRPHGCLECHRLRTRARRA